MEPVSLRPQTRRWVVPQSNFEQRLARATTVSSVSRADFGDGVAESGGRGCMGVASFNSDP